MATRIFRPVMNAGGVSARSIRIPGPLQSIGGLEVLTMELKEDVKKQKNMSRPGGGTRAVVRRVEEITIKATLQDVNPINLARAVLGTTSEVLAGTVVDEPVIAYKDGLIRLAHLAPTAVVVKKGAVTIAAAGNYEVRPEGIFVFDDALAISDEDELTVDYAHSRYDLVEAITTSAPILEMAYYGINEADGEAPSVMDIFRVQLGAVKSLGLIDKDFGTLEIEGEVLEDPTKTGAGVSRFFRYQMA